MTGSGKTGLCLALLEEAAIDGIPVIAIDPKGDIGNALLTFPNLSAGEFRPWISEEEARRKAKREERYRDLLLEYYWRSDHIGTAFPQPAAVQPGLAERDKAGPRHGEGQQIALPQPEPGAERGFHRAFGVIERQLEFGEAQHARAFYRRSAARRKRRVLSAPRRA